MPYLHDVKYVFPIDLYCYIMYVFTLLYTYANFGLQEVKTTSPYQILGKSVVIETCLSLTQHGACAK